MSEKFLKEAIEKYVGDNAQKLDSIKLDESLQQLMIDCYYAGRDSVTDELRKGLSEIDQVIKGSQGITSKVSDFYKT